MGAETARRRDLFRLPVPGQERQVSSEAENLRLTRAAARRRLRRGHADCMVVAVARALNELCVGQPCRDDGPPRSATAGQRRALGNARDAARFSACP
eukprot:7939444-Pyramimonas_sp.AAC.1